MAATQLSTSKKLLKPDDFPVNAEGKKIKKQDGTPIANTEDPAVAADVAERLNDDEARREDDNGRPDPGVFRNFQRRGNAEGERWMVLMHRGTRAGTTAARISRRCVTGAAWTSRSLFGLSCHLKRCRHFGNRHQRLVWCR